MLLFFLLFLFVGIQYGFSQISPIYLRDRFAVSSLQQGLFFSVGTMVPALIMSPIGGWLADKWSRKKIILISIGCSPLLLALWPMMNTYISLLVLRTCLGVLWMILMPALMAYLMDFIKVSQRGLASGISSFGRQLGGTVIGTTLLGYLYTTVDRKTPFYVAALFVLPAIPILLLLRKEKSDSVN
jgi:MFS family permease